MLAEKLEKFGLSRKEAKVYLTLLELGPSPVNEISKRADVNRSTAYVLLDSLVSHGLVGISEKKGIKLYNPAPPDRLVQFLEESVKKYTELIGVAHSVLPELKAIYVGIGSKPKVQFFEGLEGIKTVYEDTLTSRETIRAYASIDDMHSTLKDYFPDYYKRRAAKGIHIRSIHPDTPLSRDRIKHNDTEARESLLVPKKEFNFTSEVNIYDNKVALMLLAEKQALIIEDKELSDSFKKFFELAWLGGNTLQKRGN